MNSKEAKAQIKINGLLEEAGGRFFDNEFVFCPRKKLTKKESTAEKLIGAVVNAVAKNK